MLLQIYEKEKNDTIKIQNNTTNYVFFNFHPIDHIFEVLMIL